MHFASMKIIQISMVGKCFDSFEIQTLDFVSINKIARFFELFFLGYSEFVFCFRPHNVFSFNFCVNLYYLMLANELMI